jgi:hypothetical protein
MLKQTEAKNMLHLHQCLALYFILFSLGLTPLQLMQDSGNGVGFPLLILIPSTAPHSIVHPIIDAV